MSISKSTNSRILYIFTYFLILCLAYRITFFFQIQNSPNTPIGTNNIKAFIFAGLIDDLIVCLALSCIIFLIEYAFKKMTMFVVFLFSSILIAHIKLYTLLSTGINIIPLSTYLHQGSTILDLKSFITITDITFILTSVFLYLGIKKFQIRHIKRTLYYYIFPIYLITILFSAILVAGTLTYSNLTMATLLNKRSFYNLFCNPSHIIMSSYITSLNIYNKTRFLPGPTQKNNIRLLEEPFISAKKIKNMATKSHRTSINPAQAQNIVFIILESVGEKYIHQKVDGQSPMPFLESLAKRGWAFKNHHSSGNISAVNEFSIFTGLYPYPKPIHFELQSDRKIPTLVNWLKPSTDSFLVSASNDIYFSMTINKSFREYDNAHIIDLKNKHLLTSMFIDENVAFNFFATRLSKSTQPFLAVYWSGAAHFPYKDYSNYSHLKLENKTQRSRYFHALNLLDQEIKKTYLLLKNRKLLDNTIFIIVGDHGESFGQHDDLYVHGSSLYEEEIKIPLVIYSPHIFEPTEFLQATSNVDILPIILETLQVHYSDRLQGDTPFQNQNKRAYIFAYGDHDEIAAIDNNNHKMLISFAENTCKSYDLNSDPEELIALPCKPDLQRNAILKFRNYQPLILNGIQKLQNNLITSGQAL